MIVVLLGPPGCGKGTQGEKVAAALGVPKISTGEVLRDAAKAGTTLGLEARGYMERGDLVPDAVILGIMKEVLAAPAQAAGVILDGVVRTVPQAEGLSATLEALERPLGLVMDFAIPDEMLVVRLSGRTVCGACQTPFTGRKPGEIHAECLKVPKGTLIRRKDDEPDSIRNRLKVYHAQTAPVLDWYKSRGAPIVTIDAVGSLDEVTARSLKAVGKG